MRQEPANQALAVLAPPQLNADLQLQHHVIFFPRFLQLQPAIPTIAATRSPAIETVARLLAKQRQPIAGRILAMIQLIQSGTLVEKFLEPSVALTTPASGQLPALNPGQPKISVLLPMIIGPAVMLLINALIRGLVMPMELTIPIILALPVMPELGSINLRVQPALSAEPASNAMVLPAPARTLLPKPATAALLIVMIVRPAPALLLLKTMTAAAMPPAPNVQPAPALPVRLMKIPNVLPATTAMEL